MSWGAQNRSEDAKTPSAGRGMSENPEPGLWPVQPYHFLVLNMSKARMNNNQRSKRTQAQAQQRQRQCQPPAAFAVVAAARCCGCSALP
jgi:hypothetical protein